MEWSLKPCTTTAVSGVQNHDVSVCRVDRLTSLPDELLIRILSLLPTKDVAVTAILSRRLRRVFPLITTLDFDVSPISHCWKHPYELERFPTFVTFVDNVLFAYNSVHLSKFRLRVGNGFFTRLVRLCFNPGQDECRCHQHCLPDLKFTQLHAWISFPLTLSGLRELDLCILVRDPGQNQLPTAIFMCQTLEVLKLEFNLGLDQVSTMPSYCLPKLKLLRLCASSVYNDNFLPRLLSSCPLLEDVTFVANTNHDHHAAIHSLSLRKLCFIPYRNLTDCRDDSRDIPDFQIPNIEYFEYADDLALEYSSPIMHRLVEAKLCRLITLENEPLVNFFLITLQLLRLVSGVQRLTLAEHFLLELDYVKVKDQLPLFPNLNHLTVDCDPKYYFWDKLLWAFLNSSPVLETLVFQMGLSDYFDEEDEKRNLCDASVRLLKWESDFFRAAHATPSCCRHHLKRIVICNYFGLKREVTIIQFFLRHALVLEELVICRARKKEGSRHLDPPPHYPRPSFPPQMPDQISIERVLKNLPRASAICSIKVL